MHAFVRSASGFSRIRCWQAFLVPALALTLFCGSAAPSEKVSGEARTWHRVTLTFDGPETSEDASPNPFRDYRLNVGFTHESGKQYLVPGFFAAGGDAAETSAASGDQWRVHFMPDRPGEWRYRASFRKGKDVAVSLDPDAGEPVSFDGASGSFTVRPTNKSGRDFRAHGLLAYDGGHFLRHQGSGGYFLKGGADSPENFLAYEDFDGTYDTDPEVNEPAEDSEPEAFLHAYEPHVRDWRPGDPAWRNGKGKGIIGALNYLASKGMNSVYFLTYNVDGGDGRDVWMWTDPLVQDRYDVSKLAQWEIVFSHMDRLGILLHVITQETENDEALGGCAGLNPERKLYYRELAARFAHHPALVWNLGEENNTSDYERKQIAEYIRAVDPYGHPITVHTYVNQALEFYNGLLGDPRFETSSIQSKMQNYHREAVVLRKRSRAAGRPWVIFGDEQSTAQDGVLPDEEDPDHDIPRIEALWGNLIGGGAGVEWYFGYEHPHNDLNCEDWRSRDAMWDQTRYALDFFQRYLPFWEMSPADALANPPARPEAEEDGGEKEEDSEETSGGSGQPDEAAETDGEEASEEQSPKRVRVLAKVPEIYAVQLPEGGEASLTVGSGRYRVEWYDPRNGGDLQQGEVQWITGPGTKTLGPPPSDPDLDWMALVRRSQ